jgi:hypothetical protein
MADLPDVQHGIGQPAVIVDRQTAFERHYAGFGVDLDLGGVTPGRKCEVSESLWASASSPAVIPSGRLAGREPLPQLPRFEVAKQLRSRRHPEGRLPRCDDIAHVACDLIGDEQHKPMPRRRKVIIPLLYSLATLPIAAL